jgi:GNAT superfamily N-acetyltransferase
MSRVSTATAAVRRSNQTYLEQVSQSVSLSCGVAYFNPAHPRVPGCNLLGEVLLDDGTPDPVALVQSFYDERHLTCFGWIPAADQDPEAVGRLLEPRGYQRCEKLTYLFPPGGTVSGEEGVRILGARAMRRAYTRMIAERSAEHDDLSDDLTAVQLERLNDPQYDGFVALFEDEPVGIVSVYQVGEIGRVCDLYVARGRRGRGVATALLGQAIQTARRWGLRPICMEVAAQNVPARSLVEKTGFEPGDTIVAYMDPRVIEVGG